MAEFGTRIGKVTLKDTATTRAMAMGDSLYNLASGLGGGTDPQSRASYRPNYIDKYAIDAAYQSSAFFKKIIVGPATDAVRAWRSFQAEDADITAIENEERRLGLRDKVRRAEIMARLYGGSVIMIGTDDANLALPLDVERVKKGSLKYFHVLSRHRVMVPDLILDPGSPWFGQPSRYQVMGGQGNLIDVDPSRIVRFIHGDLPEDLLEQNQGWGSPLAESLWTNLINLDTAQAAVATLLNKLTTDTVYIPGLTSMASTTEGEEMLKRRFVVAKLFESMLNVKLMDAAASADGVGEDWKQFTLNVSGYPELMTAFAQMLAGASGYPLTKLLGTSPSGLNANGSHEEANYSEMISAGQELSLRPRLDMIDQVLVRSALGVMPLSYFFTFNALSVDSDAVKAENAFKRSQALEKLVASNTVPPEVLQEAVKNQLIESGEYPGIEQAYDDYSAGNLDSLIEEPEEAPADPLIPVDPLTGMPTQNRESRLFAANDIASRLLADGATTLEAITEAHRLTDATPRPLYVSRHLINGEEIRAHFEKQGIKVTVPNEKLHTTVCYSKAPIDWFAVAPADDWGDAEIVVKAGGARMMAKFGPTENAIVMMFASSRFSWRHEEFIRAGASYDWEYQPHFPLNYEGQKIDLDKIEPFKGELRFGPEDFQEIQEGWSATA